MSDSPQITVINGSIQGRMGNTQRILEAATRRLSDRATISELTLRDTAWNQNVEKLLGESSAFLFGTGTYWDSWGSPLQRFLEEATQSEGSTIWLGKPAAVLVSMNSVGGKQVLTRLQGVLSSFGVAIPPMSGMALSFAAQIALEKEDSQRTTDFWREADLDIICHNLWQSIVGGKDWKTWPVDAEYFGEVWMR